MSCNFILRSFILLRSFIIIVWIQTEPDVDECGMGTFSCPLNSSCANTSGSYTCDCDAGFTKQGVVCVPGQYGKHKVRQWDKRQTTAAYFFFSGYTGRLWKLIKRLIHLKEFSNFPPAWRYSCVLRLIVKNSDSKKSIWIRRWDYNYVVHMHCTFKDIKVSMQIYFTCLPFTEWKLVNIFWVMVFTLFFWKLA